MYGESWEPQPFSLVELLALEAILCRLEHSSDDDALHRENPPGIIQRLEQLQKKLDRFQFKNAYRVFTLRLDYLLYSLREEEKNGSNLLGNYTRDLRSEIGELRKVIRDDAASLAAFTTGSLSFTYVESYFLNPLGEFGLPEELAPRLPAEVTENIIEASRCLLLGFSPAAILFTCLSVEAFVKHYYYPAIAGGNLPLDKEGEFLMWGVIIDQLRNKYQCPSSITEKLDEIRKNYRNKAMHASLDISAEPGMDTKVWTLCKRVVRQMLDDLKKKDL